MIGSGPGHWISIHWQVRHGGTTSSSSQVQVTRCTQVPATVTAATAAVAVMLASHHCGSLSDIQVQARTGPRAGAGLRLRRPQLRCLQLSSSTEPGQGLPAWQPDGITVGLEDSQWMAQGSH